MTQRRKWTAIPGLLLLVIGAVVLSAYSGASSSQGHQPTQPINFPHPLHAGAVKDGGLGLNCLYCHYSGNKSLDVGMPAVSTCMGCHTIVGAERFVYGTHWPLRLTQNPRANLDLLPAELRDPPIVDAGSLAR